MRAYECDVCQHLVFFENTSCLTCGATLGFAPDRRAVVALEADENRFEIVGDAWRSALAALPQQRHRGMQLARPRLGSARRLVPELPVDPHPAGR